MCSESAILYIRSNCVDLARDRVFRAISLCRGFRPVNRFAGAGRTMEASDSGEIGVEESEAAAFLRRFGLSEVTARQYQNRLRKAALSLPSKSTDKKRRR
jgi:hypothetical protein